MNSELTNVYAIIKNYYKDIIEKFGLQDSRELSAFLHYNTINEMFIDTNDIGSEYPEINFRNLDTFKVSKAFVKENIYFFPLGNTVINNNTTDMKAFNISNVTRSVIINDNGLFIESNNLKDCIITKYYDNAALSQISKENIDINDFFNIESHIKNIGIMPDNIITAYLKYDNVEINIKENNEIISENIIYKGNDRSLYSIYYEFMKNKNFYERNNSKNNVIRK